MGNIVERSYSGKTFRPSPVIYNEPDNPLTLITTPWGSQSSAQKAVETIVKYFSAALEDVESTSPFETLTCLSPIANYMRASALLANKNLCRSENEEEFTSGLEILMMASDGDELSILQVGQPFLLLKRKGHAPIPLGYQFDLSFEFEKGGKIPPPLPLSLMGCELDCYPMIYTFHAQAGDQIILLSRSLIPVEIYQQRECNLDSLSRLLVKDHSDLPFWLGIMEIDS